MLIEEEHHLSEFSSAVSERLSCLPEETSEQVRPALE